MLDGGSAVRVMLLNATATGSSVTLSGLTLRNGDGGGGIGGGLLLRTPTASISDCIFETNANASNGGGLHFAGATLTITNSTFDRNTLATMNGAFINEGEGGGAYIDVTGSLSVMNSTFTGNGNAGRQTRFGGAMRLVGGGSVTIEDTTVTDNLSDDNGTPGVYTLDMGEITITRSTFSDNLRDPACDYPTTVHGGDQVYLRSTTNVTISESVFSGTLSPCQHLPNGGGGSALRVEQVTSGEARIVNSMFFDNDSGPARAVNISNIAGDGGATLTNNTFSGNASSHATAGDILVTSFGTVGVHLYNNIFWGPAGADVVNVSALAGVPVEIHNNDIDLAALTVSADAVYVEDNVTNLNIDPLFVDQAGGDLHIAWNSPVKDQGDNAAPSIGTVDIDGDARVLNGTVDMGADETSGTQPPPPDDPPQESTFTPTSGVLVIPELQISPTKAYRVELTRLNVPGYVFELSNFSKVKPTSNPAGTFSLKTGVLELFAVQVGGGGTTWHVQMLKRAVGFIFDMTSAKKNN